MDMCNVTGDYTEVYMKWIAAVCGQYLNIDYIAYFDYEACKSAPGFYYLHAFMHDGKKFEVSDQETTERIHKFMPKFLSSRNLDEEMQDYFRREFKDALG